MMDQRSNTTTRSLTVKYLLVLGLLAGLALVNYLILGSQIAAGRSVAEVVNLSGRQRALLQRSALIAQELASADDSDRRNELRRELLATIEPMEHTHYALIQRDSEVPAPQSVQDVYFNSPWLLDTEMRNLIAQLRALAEVPDAELGPEHPHVRYVEDTAAGRRLAEGLDAVVLAYQREVEATTDGLQNLAAWSLGSTVAVLAISGWFVFRPMVRRVRKDMDQLETLNDTLECRVAERTALAQQRAEALALSEGALRDQSRMLQSILDNMGDGVIVVESDGHFRLFNPKAREIFHIRAEDDVPGVWQPIWTKPYGVELYLPNGETPYPAKQWPLSRAARGESVDRAEVILRHPSASRPTWLSITARPLYDSDGSVSGAVAVVRDISAGKEAEKRLRDSEALYHSLVDNLPLYVLRKDLRGRFTFVNNLMCQLLNRPPDEIVGKNDFDFYPRRLAEKYRRDDSRVVEEAHLLQEVEEHETPDGRKLHVEILKAPVRDAAGHIVGTQTLFLDVTARAEAEQKLLQAERLAAIGEMVAGVAHESRNALQQIQACCGMLGWKLNGNGETEGLVRDIEKSQQRLQRLFDDLRGYAAPMKLDRRPHDVRDILAEAWAGLEHQRDGREVDFRQDPAVADTRCVVDPLALEQVFQNVLENALAACADPVAIDVRFTEVSMDGRELLEIAIRDNGPGMTDEQREKIFQPFYSTKSRGSGLGMAITRRIVQAHGGRITVGDTSLAGTEIVINIPRGEA